MLITEKIVFGVISLDKANTEELCKKIYEMAYEIYGDKLPPFISERIEWEIRSIKNYDFGDIYLKSLSLVEASEDKGYLTQSRGCTAGLLINFLLGITEINPLPPHYVCLDCGYTELHTEALCGADLPDKHCEECVKLMHKDGFNIPAEICLGFDNTKVPCFCFGVAPEVEENVRAIVNKPSDIRNDKESSLPHTEYLEFISDKELSLLKKLENLTNVKAAEIPLDDKTTLELFSAKNTCGVPEFYTPFVKNIMTKTGVNSFDDLVRILGFSHGTDVWNNNAEKLLDNTNIPLSDVISCRDDVMIYLMKKGFNSSEAFRISEKIRKGKGLSKEEYEEMLNNDIPQWYAESCNKVKYSFPRAHCVSLAMLSFRIAYYKAHYPLDFYRAYFCINVKDFDAMMLTANTKVLSQKVYELKSQINEIEKEYEYPLWEEECNKRCAELFDKIYLMETCLEMKENGYKL